MKRKISSIITIVAFLLAININFNIKSQSSNNNSLIHVNIKAFADTEGGQIDCTTLCNFVSYDVCYFSYPYGCLGKHLKWA